MTDTITGWYPIRTPGVVAHLLLDDDGRGATLIDTGLLGVPGLVRKRLARLGLTLADLHHILLTHGHLDHTGGLHTLQRASGATVCAHPGEQQHIDGRYPYTGITRMCGWMEAFGRACIGYKPVAIDQPFEDGQVLPIWGGLRVVHLPGHTVGHCGFYSERRDVLFCGDLMATTFGRIHRPPPFLNSCPERFAASFGRVAQIDPQAIVPNHYPGWQSPRQIKAIFDRHKDGRWRGEPGGDTAASG